MSRKIAVSYKGLNDEGNRDLAEYCKKLGYDMVVVQNPDDYRGCEIIFGSPPIALLPELTELKWLQTGSAGVDSYCAAGVLRDDILFTNASGGYGIGISEHLIMHLLMLKKRAFQYMEQQQRGVWENAGKVTGINGSKVTVIGLGDLGGEFAKRLHALGAEVTAVKRTATDKPDYIHKLYTTEDLEKALPDADAVALCLPNTPSTANILSRERLNMLKKGAIVLNVGRGTALDQDALIELLNSGHLGGAGLDVVKPEPLPQGHPLWTAKNVIISPHVSGGFTLDLTVKRIADLFKSNLELYTEGKPFPRVVNRKEFY